MHAYAHAGGDGVARSGFTSADIVWTDSAPILKAVFKT
jgi:hypothetical protein